jgi:rRNA-processing protein EBP2
MARSKTLVQPNKVKKDVKSKGRAATGASKPAPPKVVQRARADSVSSAESDEDQLVDGADEDEDAWEDEESEDEDEDDSGVDEEGMQKLMDALGEDGLDEMGRAHLNALAEEDGVESGEDDVEDVEEDVDEDEDAEEDEEGVALDDVSDIASDADIVPQQKIETNNTVRRFLFSCELCLCFLCSGRPGPDSGNHKAGPVISLDRDPRRVLSPYD